jgi:O-antigen/teichoic acid export membrane protein
MKGLKRLAFMGVIWSFAGQFVSFVLQFGTFAVLARLLSAHEIGLISLTASVMVLGAVLAGLSLGRALVQRQTNSKEEQSTVFWASLAIGLLGWALLALFAAPISKFFSAPELEAMLWVAGAALPITASHQVQLAILEKDLNFKDLALLQSLLSSVPYAIVTLVLALVYDQGAWSPVWGGIVSNITLTIALTVRARWLPSLQFSRETLREILPFGVHCTGASLAAFFTDNTDYYVVGRILGTGPLGHYGLAYRLVVMPTRLISGAVNRVAYPVFCAIQNDREGLNRAYLQLNRYLAFVVFPIMAGLCAVAEPTVLVLFGDGWEQGVPLVRILCISGAITAVRSTVGSMLIAIDRIDLGFYSNLVILAVTFAVLLVLVPHGLQATAWGMVLVALVNFVPLQVVVSRLNDMSLRSFFGALLLPALLSIAMGSSVWWLISHVETPVLKLVAGVPLGAMLYVAALRVLAPGVFGQIITLLRRDAPSPDET